MSITDELREWLENAYTYGTGDDLFKKNYSPWFGWKLVLEPMLDRIDAEHESKVSYWQETSYKDGYDEGFASADDYFTDKRETLEEHGWVKLPVDADGVPIRVGDVMDERLPFGGYAAPAPVDVMELSRGANGYVWMVRLDAANSAFINPKLLRHHHPPTVEDVLTELEGMRGNGKTYEDVVMRCADLAGILRELLAGEDE